MRDFDPDAFERFIDELIPDDDGFSPIDGVAEVLRQVGRWLAEHEVAMDQRATLAQLVIEPWLRQQASISLKDGSRIPITGHERLEMKRKWSEAIGFDIPLPS